MNEPKSIHVHPEQRPELPSTGETHLQKPSRIPLPNYTAWNTGNPKNIGTKIPVFKKRPAPNNSISAPTSPRHRSHSPSPLASPARSTASEKSTPTRKQHGVDECRSLPLIPQTGSRIPLPIPKNRYNMMLTESNTSLPESTESSEFLSTVCLGGSPYHDQESSSDKTIVDSLPMSFDEGSRQSSKSPCMLYPLSEAVIKSGVEEEEMNNKDDVESTLSFSTISIPSKVSLVSRKGGDSSSSSNSLKSSLYELNEDTSNIKMSIDGSECFEENIDILREDNMTVLKTLDEAQTNIEFLEAENYTLLEKSHTDTLKISKLKLVVAQLEEQADKIKIDSFSEKLALESHEKKIQNELQTQLTEVTKQKQDLQDKFVATEKEHSLCNQQIKMVSLSKNDIENQLLNIKAELFSSHDRVKNLQETVKTLQNERNGYRSSLDAEKSHVSDLQSSLDSMTVSLATMTRQVETLHDEKENLTRAFQNKEEDTKGLAEDLKCIKQEKADSIKRYQSLQSEKDRLVDELKQAKLSLSQAWGQHKSSQLQVREIGQELSLSKCEAKEMVAISNSEAKENKAMFKENRELRNRIEKLEEDLIGKEKELTLERKSNEVKVVDMNKELKKKDTSRTQEILQLVSEMAELKSKNRQLQETMEEKEGAIRNLKLQQTILQCSLESEREEKNTLALKATTLEDDVSSLRSQYQTLDSHNQELKEITEQKFLSIKEVEDSLRKQVQNNIDSIKQKDDELHSTVIKLKQVETELEKSKAKSIEYETQVTLLTADVENHKRLCNNLQSKLQLIQDSKSQEILALNAQLDSKRSEISKLSARLDSIHMEKENLKKTLKESTEKLEHEKRVLVSVQSELTTAENNGTELNSYLSTLDEHIKSLTLLNNDQKQQLQEAEMKIEQRTKELELFQENLNQEIDKREKERLESDERQQQLQEEIQNIIQERNASERSFQKTTEILNSTQEKLEEVERDLEKTKLELRKQLEEYNSLSLSMVTKTASRNELAKMYTILETEHEQSCLRVTDLSSKLNVSNEEGNEVRQQLKESERFSSILQNDIKTIEEVKTMKERQMEGKLAEVISQYEKEVLDSKTANNILQTLNDKLSTEVSHFKTESSTFQKKVEAGNALKQQLQARIEENKARDMVLSKRISELEVQLATETESEAAVRRELSAITSKEKDLQLKYDELQSKIYLVTINKDNVERKLEEEKRKTSSLQKDIENTEIELKKKRNALFKEKEQRTDLKFKSDAELTQFKHKYHAEVKTWKEKNKDLQAELQLLKSNYTAKTMANEKIQASCDNLERTNNILQSQIEKKQRQLKENNQILKSCEIRNQSLDIQLAQLQLEASTLANSQLEFEEYKKKIESSSREELQRVLKEVTQHMEEQHTANHYLEKLRKENESIALKEKDRQIDHLKSQLKRKKQELKKDKLQIESMEIESRFLKSQQSDSTNARHKIESHLGKISDALSISARSTSFSASAPHASSTPITNRNKSFQ